MWRRRPLTVSRASLSTFLSGRRALRLAILGVVGALMLVWVRGSAPASVTATATATSAAVVQNFGSRLTTAGTQIRLSPKVATHVGDALVAIVEVRRITGLTMVTSITDSGGDSWARAASVHNRNIDEELWYVNGAAAIPTTGTFTVKTPLAASIAVTVVEMSGIASTAPLDVTDTSTGVSAHPAIGPTAATGATGEIAIGAIGWGGSVTASKQTAGYTLLPAKQSTAAGEPAGEVTATRLLPSTGAQTYGATLSASAPWTGILATFEAQPVPPTPTPSPTPTATPSPSPTPTGSPIKHVVVIYQENHSFDEVLGNWCFTTQRCTGYDVTQPVTLEGGTQQTLQQSPDIVPQVDHSVASQALAIDGGLMDGWAGIPGCGATSTIVGAIPYGCLSYYAPTQIPNLVSLGTSFVVSDQTFSMADSPSWGGHLYAVAATNDHFTGDNPIPPQPTPVGYVVGPGWGCDSNKVTPWIDPSTGVTSIIPSCIPDPGLGLPNGGAFEATPAQYVPTIMDRLDAAALSWRLYTAPSGDSDYIWAVCPSFAECLDSGQSQDMVPTQQVLTDAAAGTLPSYSLVLGGAPPSYNNLAQHNGMSMTVGDNWIGRVVSAIENGPDWDSTAIFITYDDCGCFYDHVVPGLNPDGTQQGTRVPMVIVSPYARAGYTDSTPASFASILAYVEQTFGLAPLGVNDAAAYPYTNSFDYSQTPLPGVRMQHETITSAEQQYIDAHPDSPDDPT
jgi:phospholipase C